MKSALLKERSALDAFEPLWRKKGYTLVREPSQDELPGFLKGFHPDAIAVGVKPSLAIEVVGGQGAAAEDKIRRLRAAFEGRDDWRLEVVYVGPDGAPLAPASRTEVLATLRRAKVLADSEPAAAFLMGWATLEAIARILQPEPASRSLAALTVVDLLVAYGHVTQEEGLKLRRLAVERNRLAHGQIDFAPARDDIRDLCELGERLIAEAATN
jgi:hypothetical protein